MKKTKLRFYAALFGAGLLAAMLLPYPCAAEETEETEASESETDPNAGKYTSGDYTYSVLLNEDETERAACIEAYNGSDTELVLPSELDGLEVVALGNYALTSMPELKTVTLPKTLQQLGDFTFADCTGIESYAIESENQFFEVQNGVLYSNNGATLARWPLGTNPTDIEIPDGITEIGNVAFCDSQTLKSVEFPNTLNYIGLSAFAECSSLTEVSFPESVIEIGSFAFNSCTALKSVFFPDSLQRIGNAAFAVTALEEITLPPMLVSIGQQAFAETKLKSVTIPASVSDIGYSAFGWGITQSGEMIEDEDFVIYGKSGTAAEEYAYDSEAGNHFEFIESGSEEPGKETADAHDHDHDNLQPESTGEAAEEEPQNGVSGLVRVIGIAVCGVLIAAILVVALLSGRKKSPKEAQADTAEKAEPEQADTAEKAEPEQADTAEKAEPEQTETETEEAPKDEA